MRDARAPRAERARALGGLPAAQLIERRGRPRARGQAAVGLLRALRRRRRAGLGARRARRARRGPARDRRRQARRHRHRPRRPTRAAFLEGSTAAHATRCATRSRVNPFLGADSIAPFLDACARARRGRLRARAHVEQGQRRVPGPRRAAALASASPTRSRAGARSSSANAGSRASARWSARRTPRELARLRARMPRTPFLLPGYGAQGAGARRRARRLPAPASSGRARRAGELLARHRSSPTRSARYAGALEGRDARRARRDDRRRSARRSAARAMTSRLEPRPRRARRRLGLRGVLGRARSPVGRARAGAAAGAARRAARCRPDGPLRADARADARGDARARARAARARTSRVLDSVRALRATGRVRRGHRPAARLPRLAALRALQGAAAMRLARSLTQAWERPVVPIFWNHADDHDVAEVHHAHLRQREPRPAEDRAGGALVGAPAALAHRARRGAATARRDPRVARADRSSDQPHGERALELFLPRDGETLRGAFTRALTGLLGRSACRARARLDPRRALARPRATA